MEGTAWRHAKAGLDDLRSIRSFVEKELSARRVDPQIRDGLVFGANEVATNSLVHGYADQRGPLEVIVRQHGTAVWIILRDQAPPFDPTGLPDPDLTLPLEKRPMGGLGLYMTRQYVDQIRHRITAHNGNEVILVKQDVF